MARQVDAELLEALEAPVVSPFLLADFEFDSGTLRFWTGIGPLSLGGFEWTGGGNLVGVSPCNEKQALEAQGMKFTLNGISSALLSAIMLEEYQGRRCNLYISAFSTASQIIGLEDDGDLLLENGDTISLEQANVLEAYKIFSGIMDTMEFSDDGKEAIITLNAENILIELRRTKTRRLTDQDQQQRFPGDRGLEFVAGLQDKVVNWWGNNK